MTRKTKQEVVTFSEGDLVRFKEGDRGSYIVMSSELAADGSISLYGGDIDPSGHRRYRAVMPDRLIAENRKHVLAKRQRQDHDV